MKSKSSGKQPTSTSSGNKSSMNSEKSTQRSKSNDAGSSKSSSRESAKSPAKKTSKHLDARSPTKKSLDYLSKIAAADEDDPEDAIGNISSPGLRKYTRDISDVAGKRLPHIPEQEILEYTLPEDLSEIERLKILLKKDNNDQLSYFFNNIEQVFKIERPTHHALFGNEYDRPKQRAKNLRYNYETQSRFGTFLRIQSSIRDKESEIGATILKTESQSDTRVESATSPKTNASKQFLELPKSPKTDPTADETMIVINQNEQDTSKSNLHNNNQTSSDQLEDDSTQKALKQDASNSIELTEKREYQLKIQKEVLPLILENKWIEMQSEYLQILTGEAFLCLLKAADQVELTETVLSQIKDQSLVMLQQWSADILEIWAEVYSLTLAALTKLKRKQKGGDLEELAAAYLECKQVVQKMSDRNQTIKVRIKAASLVGQLAKYDSLGDPDRFRQFFLQKLPHQCQDLHWEVRKEMCHHLIHVSRYIGPKGAEERVLPELKELLEDEEGEVATEAVAQYQKHLATVLPLEFVKSPEALDIFCNFCDQTDRSDLCGMDFAIVLKKLGKIVVTLNRPDDQQLLTRIENLLALGMRSNQDEEIRAMVPCAFEGITFLYKENLPVLLELYEKHVAPFVQSEIRKGQESKKKERIDSARSWTKGILYDLVESEKQSKLQREDNNDLNYLVNRSIAQNLHFFFGALVQAFRAKQEKGDQEILKELRSPTALSPLSATSPSERKSKVLGTVKMSDPNNIDIDRARKCIIDILENYRLLLKTKDQELMHHVLFSFDCYHSEITKIDLWQSTYRKGLGEGIRELYIDLVKNHLIPAETVVSSCWRYHLTFLKVVESLIDNSSKYNEKFHKEKSVDNLGNKVISPNISSKIKPFSSHMLASDLIQIIINNVNDGTGDLLTISQLKQKKIKLQNQSNTAQQVRLYAFEVLARQMTKNKSSKIRGKIIDFTTRLTKYKTQAAKGAYLGIMNALISRNMISSKFFQQHFFDSFLQVIDDNGANQNHLKVLRDFSRKVVPLIFDDSLHLDKFNYQISLLRNRCENQTNSSAQKILKRGHVHKLILQEIESFVAFMKRKALKEEVKEYLSTVDRDLIMQEDVLNGVFQAPSRNSREYHSIKEEYSLTRNVGIHKNSSRTNLNKADLSKKPFSVRATSKVGSRDRKLPPSSSAAAPANDRTVNPNSGGTSTSAGTAHTTIHHKDATKTIQSNIEVLDSQSGHANESNNRRRLKSLRPPSQPFQKRSGLPTGPSQKDNVSRQHTTFGQLQNQNVNVGSLRQSSQSPRGGFGQQTSPEQRAVFINGSKKHNSNMDVGLSGSVSVHGKANANPGHPRHELTLPSGKPPKVAARPEQKANFCHDSSSDSDQENAVKINMRFKNDNKKSEAVMLPNKERRLSSMSSALSEKDHEGSSNATHSEKITKKKGVIIDNHEMCRSSMGGKTTALTSSSASTKMLPPRTKGIQIQKVGGVPPSQILKKTEETELYLDQKINILDQYRTTEKAVCYTNLVGSDQLLVQKSSDPSQKIVSDSQSSAQNLFKRAQMQNRVSQNNGSGVPIVVKDVRNSKSTLSKLSDAKTKKNQENLANSGPQQSNSRTTYHQIMSNVLGQNNLTNQQQMLKKSNIQLNNKITSKQAEQEHHKQVQSQQNTIDAIQETQSSFEQMRPGSSHYDVVGSSYFPRNGKFQDRYIDQINLKQKMITPTHFQQSNTYEKKDETGLKQSVLQSIAMMKPPNTVDKLNTKANDSAKNVDQPPHQTSLTIHKNSTNIQRFMNNQSQVSAQSVFQQSVKTDSKEQKHGQVKADTGIISSYTTQQSSLLPDNSASIPSRQRLKSLNMNQINGSKAYNQVTSSQGSQGYLFGANTPLPNMGTPLPRIDTKEPKTIENSKEQLGSLGVTKQATEYQYSNPLEDISPTTKKEKLDATLLTRELAKSKQMSTTHGKTHTKFGAPKEYRPPLGGVASASTKTTGGMRGSTVQSLNSQYQVKQHQQLLNKNSSKQSLNFQLPTNQQLNPDDLFSSKEIYSINGVTLTSKQPTKQINKRNSDLKKANHSMLGYLAGVTAIGTSLSRPMSNGSQTNQIRGAFGTGYKQA